MILITVECVTLLLTSGTRSKLSLSELRRIFVAWTENLEFGDGGDHFVISVSFTFPVWSVCVIEVSVVVVVVARPDVARGACRWQ